MCHITGPIRPMHYLLYLYKFTNSEWIGKASAARRSYSLFLTHPLMTDEMIERTVFSTIA